MSPLFLRKFYERGFKLVHSEDHALTPVIVEVDEDVETLEVLSDPAKLKEHEDL